MKNAVYVNFNTMCENWTNGFDDLRGIIQILNANGIVSRSEGKTAAVNVVVLGNEQVSII